MVAAGSGVRMGSASPKPLILLGGRTLLSRSVGALVAGGADLVVVMAPGASLELFRAALDAELGPAHGVQVLAGGQRRQDSVRLGLEWMADHLRGDAVVLVHDAARPLVPASVVRGVVAGVRAGHDAVVPVVPVIDSIRAVDAGGSTVVDRSGLRAVQTPQGFDLATLLAAHREIERRGLEVTDDAACCEACGLGVHLVPGSRDALKITEPVDLVLAEAMLSQTAAPGGAGAGEEPLT